jgi:hypothetical protein
MCEDTPEERSFFSRLQGTITNSLNSALADYNALRPHIERLEAQNEADRGAIVEGATSMITNRVNGAYALYKSPQAFYNAGLSGFKWAYYFSRNDNLNSDVYYAGMAALYNKLWPLSLAGVVTVSTTGLDLATGGTQELRDHVRKRYEQQRNALVVSGGLSLGVTQVFKHVGSVVQTDMQRMMVRASMRT